MSSIPRIHCHSAFKHYQMFHSNYESSYGNSVFNTTYNFNGGSICGGGFLGGLFGGLGMGLGAGLMSWLGGGMGMFGGGFPMMNMFGGGFNMFGGGFPMMNMWGGGGVSDGAGGRSNNTNTNTTNNNNNHECKKCEDKDGEICNAFQAKIFELKNKETITQDDIDKLRDEIKAAKDKNDDYHKTVDETHYNDLLKQLDDIKPKGETPSTVTQVSPVDTPDKNDAINVTLQFAKHSGEKIKDENIKGTISGVKFGTDGEAIGYIIDCKSDSDSKFKLKYEVTINNGIYNIRCISRTQSQVADKKLYTPADGINFKKEGNLLVRENDSDEPLVSEHQKEGYNQVIEYSEEDDEEFDLPDGYIEVDDGKAEIDGKKVKVQV